MQKRFTNLVLISTTIVMLTGCHSKKQETNTSTSKKQIVQIQDKNKLKKEFIKLYQKQTSQIETGESNHHCFTLEIPKLEAVRGHDQGANTTTVLKDFKYTEEIETKVSDQFKLGKFTVQIGQKKLTGEIKIRGDQRLANVDSFLGAVPLTNELNLALGGKDLPSEELKKVAEIRKRNSKDKFVKFTEGEHPLDSLGDYHQLACDFFFFFSRKIDQIDPKNFQIKNNQYTCTVDKKTLLALLFQDDSPLKVRDIKYKEQQLKETEDYLNENFGRFPKLRDDYKNEEMIKAKKDAEETCVKKQEVRNKALNEAKKLKLTLTLNPQNKKISATLELTADFNSTVVTTKINTDDQILKNKTFIDSNLPGDDKIMPEEEFNNLFKEITEAGAKKG